MIYRSVCRTTAALLLLLLPAASAATLALECRKLAAQRWSLNVKKTDARCGQSVCGPVPESSCSFQDRLAPQCSELMRKYRSTWSYEGLSNLLTEDHVCLAKPRARTTPHAPVLLSSLPPVTPFVISSLPKSGCTNLRKLVSTIMLHPEPMPTESFAQFFDIHIWGYPTVWHYDASNATCQPSESSVCAQSLPEGATRLPSSVPSFVVGRNPYIRVVSGFLDKMVPDKSRHDQWTYKMVNTFMGLETETRWEDSPESFREFVKKLVESDLHKQDPHFAVQSTLASTSFRMDYYLRLEEMSQWFPCWMQALGLRHLTETGWTDSEHGRMRVGEGTHWITESEPWEKVEDSAKKYLTQLSSSKRSLLRAGADSWATTDALLGQGGPGGLPSDAAESQLSASESNERGRAGAGLGWNNSTVLFMAGKQGKRLLAERRRTKRLVEGDKCWWSPKGWTCEEYYASFTLPDGIVVPGPLQAAMFRFPTLGTEKSTPLLQEEASSTKKKSTESGAGGSSDEHDQHAAGKWQRYYDQETADLVYNNYFEDMRLFGYERFVVPYSQPSSSQLPAAQGWY